LSPKISAPATPKKIEDHTGIQLQHFAGQAASSSKKRGDPR
jgi:hypothetical protein